MFEIIPAVTVCKGKCISSGPFTPKDKSRSDDPVEVGRQWQTLGARWLHIRDISGGEYDHSDPLDYIGPLVANSGLAIQFSAWLSSREAIQSLLDSGVRRCVIGDFAFCEPQRAQQMFAEFGDAIALNINVQEGMVSGSDIALGRPIPAVHYAQTMQEFGCRRIFLTDVSRTNTLAGPDGAAIRQVTEALEIPVLVSGGVHKTTDIRILQQLPNVEGAIVARGLYEGVATLSQLQHVARG